MVGLYLVVPVLVLAGALGSPSIRAATPAPTAKEQKIPADAPPAIPIAEIAGRADEVGAFLRSLDERLPAGPQIKKIEQELPPLSERLAERVEQTQQTIESRHALGTLDALTDSWRSSRGGLAAWMALVTERADWLEQQRADLARLAATWTRTRTEVRAAKAPPELSQRIVDVLTALAEAQGRVEAERATTLVLQDRVARELTRIDGVLAQLALARRETAGGLLVRDSPPIWRVQIPPPGSRAPVGAALETVITAVRQFVDEHYDRIALHLVGLLTLVALLWLARGRARRLPAPEGSAPPPTIAFDQRPWCWAPWRRSGSTPRSRERPGSSSRSACFRRWC
jgi:hypothetical protein